MSNPPTADAPQHRACKEPALPTDSSLARSTMRESTITSLNATESEVIAIASVAPAAVCTRFARLSQAPTPSNPDKIRYGRRR